MREFRQVFLGILAALISAGIILGSLSITLVEGRLYNAINATPTLYVVLVTQPIPTILPSRPGAQSTASIAVALNTPLSLTGTPVPSIPSPTPRCTKPEGWSIILVSLGDTLASLAEAFNTTEEVLVEANCMDVASLYPGTELYVPYVYPTEVVAQCGPPPGWVFYTIRSGDTLFDLARRLGVTVPQLQFANCLGNSTMIRAGYKLYVPFIPVVTAVVPPTDTPQPQPSDTATIMPSATEVSTSTPTQEVPATPTVTRIPTLIPTFTATPTEPPTEVPTSTPTATSIPTSTATQTSQPTSTVTDTPHPPPPTATETPLPPTATITQTPVRPW